MLLLSVLLRSGTSSASSAPASSSLEVPRVLTGNTATWLRDRVQLANEVLQPNVPNNVLDDVVLSIVAQWAHETARGQAEYNFNLAGWKARPTDHYFVGDDAGSPFRWTAYGDLPNAVADQLQRLHDRFPTAWALLVAHPKSSAWVEELGRKGYYQQRPGDYARAWAMHRAELGGRLVS
jgi:hypothetical protein